MLALERLGLYAAPHKVACGSPLPALGLLVVGGEGVVRCPSGKRSAVLADVALQRALAIDAGCVDRRKAERLVGRLCNLSQVAPALRHHLGAGYVLVNSSWPGARRGVGVLHPKPGGHALRDWLCLLDCAESELTANVGVCMAHKLVAASRLAPGTLTSVTDASGDDGFGGYAFLADSPNTVFIMSVEWPPFALSALKASACEAQARLREAGHASALPHLSMPAAELFASAALPLAVARTSSVSSTCAVGDCGPAVGTIRAMHSGNAQMRAILEAIQSMDVPFISVKVPREANQDADRLSHPEQLRLLLQEAAALGLDVVELSPSVDDWDVLRRAVDQPPATRPRKRPKPHHLSASVLPAPAS